MRKFISLALKMSVRNCTRTLFSHLTSFPRCNGLLSPVVAPVNIFSGPAITPCIQLCSSFHTTSVAQAKRPKFGVDALEGPKLWPVYNKVKLPPQLPEEPRRAAQVFHQRTQIRHSEQKLWYIAQMIRGLSIEEALKQLEFHPVKAAHIIREVLLEAQEKAVKEQNFEFKSKMWVAESFATRGIHVKGLRRHARMRYGKVSYNFNHYFVKLEEGDPPAQYYPARSLTKSEWIQDYVDHHRSKRIHRTL